MRKVAYSCLLQDRAGVHEGAAWSTAPISVGAGRWWQILQAALPHET
jgi:hypothetical protein